jgi:hypothetical protein
VATWNFEWLTLKGDQRAGVRHQDDYQQLSSIFVQLAPDVLAFQEVDSPEALARVIPTEAYNVYFSDRYAALKDSTQSQQLTGFAVRKDWKVDDPRDLRQIALPGFFWRALSAIWHLCCGHTAGPRTGSYAVGAS